MRRLTLTSPLIGIIMFLFFVVISQASIYSQQAKAFRHGEVLKYSIYYGPIRGGEAVMEVKAGSFNGNITNHLYLNGITVGLANVLYNVNDTYQSFTDSETDLPFKAIRDIKEGRYKKYTVQTFDHWSRADSSIVTSTSTGKVVVPKNSHDILSAFYYLRNHLLSTSLKVGDTLLIETYFDDERFPLIVRYLGNEKLKTKLGQIDCLKFLPIVITGRVFKSRDDMTVWFSNDKNFIPIRIKFDIYVGSVYCDLVSHKGLTHPFDALHQP
jgi:hypothetical protein